MDMKLFKNNMDWYEMLIVIAAILAVTTATFSLYVEHYTIKTIEAGALTVEDRAARPPVQEETVCTDDNNNSILFGRVTGIDLKAHYEAQGWKCETILIPTTEYFAPKD